MGDRAGRQQHHKRTSEGREEGGGPEGEREALRTIGFDKSLERRRGGCEGPVLRRPTPAARGRRRAAMGRVAAPATDGRFDECAFFHQALNHPDAHADGHSSGTMTPTLRSRCRAALDRNHVQGLHLPTMELDMLIL